MRKVTILLVFFSSDNGVLLNTSENILISCPCALNQNEYTVPQGIVTIGNRAFDNSSTLTSVTIPDSVTTIEECAFYQCSNLAEISIPNSITYIGDNAFNYCSSLTSVTIPNNLTTIGFGTFACCASLDSITIPDCISSIGALAFAHCTSLSSIVMPKSITSIGENAFYNCPVLMITVEQDSYTQKYCIDNNILYTLSEAGELSADQSIEGKGSSDDGIIFDCRNSRWGDSIVDVKKAEGEPIYQTQNDGVTIIMYDTTVAGLNSYLTFSFNNEGLTWIGYTLHEKHTNNSLFIDDFNKLKEVISKKYGSPSIDTEKWDTSSHKQYYADNKGRALEFGFLQYMTVYDLERTEIRMMMSADNYEITTQVVYISKTNSSSEVDYSDDF